MVCQVVELRHRIDPEIRDLGANLLKLVCVSDWRELVALLECYQTGVHLLTE